MLQQLNKTYNWNEINNTIETVPANFLGSRSVLKSQSQVDVPQKDPNFSYSNSQISTTTREQWQENLFFKINTVTILLGSWYNFLTLIICCHSTCFFINYLDLTDPTRK
jgi:hypothetical protein